MPKDTKDYQRGFIPKRENVSHERQMAINAPQDFEGREEELSFIQRSYESGTRVVVLWGIGGIGKTALARKFISGSQYSCPQEVFFRDDENQQVTFTPPNGDDILDILLDQENKSPIALGDGNGKVMRFEQVAVVPYNDELYCILRPMDVIEGIGADEAVVFLCDTDDNGDTVLKIEQDDETAIAVFERYYVLLAEANIPDEE